MITEQTKLRLMKANADDVNFAYVSLCRDGNLEGLKIMFNEPEINKKINLHVQDDLGFREACFNSNLNIAKYLILELNLEKTKKIKDYLDASPHIEFKRLEMLFDARDLNHKLNKNLPRENIGKEFNKSLKI